MAVSTGYDYGIKSGLVGKGVDPSSISYDPGRGYVTVSGKDFLKADKVFNGSSFTNQQKFDNAWNAYNTAAPAGSNGTGFSMLSSTPGVSSGAGAAAAVASQAPSAPTQTTPTTPSYMDAYNQHMATIDKLMNQPVDPNAIYASPEYAAYQAQAARQAQASTRAAQEAYGSAGFGRSYGLGERAQDYQNEANTYLDTQVVPQLMAQSRADQQQRLQNEYGLLDQYWNQINRGDTLDQNAQSNAINIGQLTGSYTSPQQQDAVDHILNLKQQAEAAGITAEERAKLSTEANGWRDRLKAAGGNPDALGAGVSLANAGKASLGTPTLAAQGQSFDQGLATKQFNSSEEQRGLDNQFRNDQFDRNKYESDRSYRQQVQQQAISDGQWQQQFNMDVEKFGFQQASELWSQAFQMNQSNQDNALKLSQADKDAAYQATGAISKSGLVTTTTDPFTGQESTNVTNPDSLSKYIISLGLSDNATDSLLYQYGLDSYVKK